MVKAALMFLLLAAGALGAGEKAVGFVLKVQGEWLIDGQTVKQAGGSVPANATIDLPPQTSFRSGQSWQISIVLLNDKLLKYSCDSFDSCRKVLPAHAPSSLTDASPLLDRVRTAIGRLLTSDPDRYVPAISRGAVGPKQRLQDAVLRLSDGRLDVREWFDGVAPGQYALTLDYIGRDESSRSPVELAFEWGNGSQQSIAAPKVLRTGLYLARVYDAAGAPISRDTWLAVFDSSGFAAASAAFREDRQAAAGWRSQDPEAAETFLRACLDALAQPYGPR